MQKAIAAVLAFAGLVAGSSATAQSWGVYVGAGSGDYPSYRGYDSNQRQIDYVCSGQRGYTLENRLRHEEQEDEIDPDQADRIHDAIDKLEAKQQHECDEGDWRSVRDIARRYDGVERWIDREAHGRWRDGW